MCDDIEATRDELKAKGVEFEGEILDEGFQVDHPFQSPGNRPHDAVSAPPSGCLQPVVKIAPYSRCTGFGLRFGVSLGVAGRVAHTVWPAGVCVWWSVWLRWCKSLWHRWHSNAISPLDVPRPGACQGIKWWATHRSMVARHSTHPRSRTANAKNC